MCVSQVDEAVLDEVAKAGYKSVLNLRRLVEPNLENEEALCQARGLVYASSPVTASPDGIDAKAVLDAVSVLHNLPQPVFIHCASGGRASVVVLTHRHRHEKAFASVEEFVNAAVQQGFMYNDNWRKVIQDDLFANISKA